MIFFQTWELPSEKNTSRNILMNSGILSQTVEVCPKTVSLELLIVLSTLWVWIHVSNPREYIK